MRNATEPKATERNEMIVLSEKAKDLLGHLGACTTCEFNDDSIATVAWMDNVQPMYRVQTESFFELANNGLIVVDEAGCPPFENGWFVQITPEGLTLAQYLV